MLNSLLNHFLFGLSANDNNINTNSTTTTTTNTEEEEQQQGECLTQSAIISNKFIDVRNDVDWVIVDPSDNEGNSIEFFKF